MLRCLHDPDRGIGEQAERAAHDAAIDDEIGIEEQHELRRSPVREGMAQAVVHIAGLGVCMFAAGEIERAQLFGERTHPVAPTVVEHEHPQIGVSHRHGADDRAFQHLVGFVVGGDQDIDRSIEQRAVRRGARRGRTVKTAGEEQEGQQRAGNAQRLETQEQHRPRLLPERLAVREAVGIAPVDVAPHQRGAEHRGGSARRDPARPVRQQQQCQQAERQEQRHQGE